MGGPRHVVGQKGLVRRHGVLRLDPGDGMIRQVPVEDVVLVVVRRFYWFRPFEEGRPPLVGLGAEEAVEILKPEVRRPEIERAGLAGLPVGDVVILSIPGGAVAVLLQDLGKGADALRHHRIVAGVAGPHLHDDARGRRMVVPSRQEGRPRRRTEGRRMKCRIAQSVVRKAVEGRRRYRSAEGGARPETHVIGHDDQNVRGPFRGRYRLGEVGNRVLHRPADMAFERLLRPGQDVTCPRRRQAEQL